MEEGRKIYSDHNVITIHANWVITSLEKKKISYCLTQKGKEKLKEVTENSQLAKIWEGEGTTQEKYTLWNQKVIEITDKIFKDTKKRKSGKCRKIKLFQRQRKILQIKFQQSESKEEKNILKKREKLIFEFIREVYSKNKKGQEYQNTKKMHQTNG